MRHESSVLSVSWIPSEAVVGLGRLAFDAGLTHYDDPPPDAIDDLDDLRAADRFRFANHLSASIDVDDGRIVGHEHRGGGLIGSTTVSLGITDITFAAFQLPIIRHEPEVTERSVRFVQTTGGRTGLPAPRRVSHRPYVQYRAPLVWTTLALTMHADGTAEHEVVGASSFPRHWIYGPDRRLQTKVGLMDFKDWYRRAFGIHTPWGDEDSPALVTAAETALERQLSTTIMRGGGSPTIREVAAGTVVVRQGDRATDLLLLLDGIVRVEVDGVDIAECGPGAVLGERSALEGAGRTATLIAATPVRIALAPVDRLDPAHLREVSRGHRREDAPARSTDEQASTTRGGLPGR